ncbi:MAG TPA: transketolase C-terminal domain-containing protein [Tepidisphaeraceae bacterium]|nr:transketolase C-terminal domain-containing protein [Tepidisphaeraceae bacterium]
MATATATEPKTAAFPIDLKALKPLKLDPKRGVLTAEEKAALLHNVALCRDAVVFFTSVADTKGLGGHTGGAYDTIPEVLIIRAFIESGAPIVPIFFDEAGHRVATQYLLSVLDGDMPPEKLLQYREYHQHLPGHPERNMTPGVKFSSGRLGHIWAMCNGVAMANPGKAAFMLGSDGAQMEGDDAEAARLAVAKNVNVKVLIDDNNVTIAGHPQEYMRGFDVAKTLAGHGLTVSEVDGENIDALYGAVANAFLQQGPIAVVVKRKMAPGIDGLEGHTHAHESIKADKAIAYLEKRGRTEAANYLKAVKGEKNTYVFKGSKGAGKNRDDFGKIVNSLLDAMSPEERVAKVRVFDNDLEGSCGLHHIRKKYPEVYVSAGIMERGNFSAAAGFGFDKGKQGIYGTFSAFLEMVISEITMARLNYCNVLAHFSHAGCDDMADNSCHFGINNMFAANGLPGEAEEGGDTTRLYFPADQHQFAACVRRIFNDPGLRFIFSTRAAVPDILKPDGSLFYGDGYTFEPDKDDVILEAPAGGGYVVAFGEVLYRAYDALLRLNEQGIKVGLINKPTLNGFDPATMKRLKDAPFVLVAEGFNVTTGVGSKFGSDLLKHGFRGKYNNIGTHKEGSGGLWQQMGFQGLDPEGIARSVKALL